MAATEADALEIFVSHSARVRPDEELVDESGQQQRWRKTFIARLLRGLRDELADRGHHAWIDEDEIVPSMEFTTEIHTALGTCDGAVVVVDRDALRSPYVLKEVLVLMWRHAVEGIPVIPLLIEVTYDQVRQSQLGSLTDLHRISARSRATNLRGEEAMRLAAETAELLDQVCDVSDGSAVRRWIDDMAHFLKDISSPGLWRMADRLGVDRESWRRARNHHQVVAAAMLSSSTADILAALTLAVDLLDDRASRRVVDRAVPLWVNLDAGRVVAEAAHDEPSRRIVGISTRSPRLATDVVRRATAGAPEHQVAGSDVVGESAASELIERYDACLRKELWIRPGTTPEQTAEEIEELPGTVFAIIRIEALREGTVDAVIKTLRSRFPGVVFVAIAPSMHTAWDTFGWPRAYPDLTPREEDRAHQFIGRAKRLVGESVPFEEDL